MKFGIFGLGVLVLLKSGFCSPPEEKRKNEVRIGAGPQMSTSLDLTSPFITNVCNFQRREVDGDVYSDITVRPGVTINEVYNGIDEVWRAKGNRKLVKMVIIQKKDKNTYIIMTKDKDDRLAETYIMVTKVLLTFNPVSDPDYALMVYSDDTADQKSRNLRIAQTQIDLDEIKLINETKIPTQNREYYKQPVGPSLARQKIRDIEEEERRKFIPNMLKENIQQKQ